MTPEQMKERARRVEAGAGMMGVTAAIEEVAALWKELARLDEREHTVWREAVELRQELDEAKEEIEALRGKLAEAGQALVV